MRFALGAQAKRTATDFPYCLNIFAPSDILRQTVMISLNPTGTGNNVAFANSSRFA
jgi:hypothetical protein